MSRPSSYSEGIAESICDLISEGLSLVQICQRDEMPHRATVLRWMNSKPDFANRIARAREGGQADFLFDDIARIERSVESGEIAPDAARILISSKQWRAAKLAPKRFGDKTTVETNGTVKVEVLTRKLDISLLTDAELDSLETALRATVAQLNAPGVGHDE